MARGRKPRVSRRKRYVGLRSYMRNGAQIVKLRSKKYSKPSCFKRLGQLIMIGNKANGADGPGIINTADGNGSCQVGSWGTAGYMNTAQVGGSLQFKLESAVDYGDFAQLFDRYKITGVKLKFMYQENIGSTGNNSLLPTFNYSFDGDDADVPTTQLMVTKKQYCHSKVLNGNKSFSLFIKPRITAPTTLSGTYTTSKAKWVDCNTGTGVPHYGVKFWLKDWTYGTVSTPVLNLLTIQPTYYFALKDTQ